MNALNALGGLPLQPVVAVPPVKTGSESRSRVLVARAACTHTIMDRVYGNYACQVCHKVPSMGFVYFCQQDLVHGPPNQLPTPLPISKANRRRLQKGPTAAHERNWSTGTQFEMLGFNKAIVKSAEDGHYTPEQIAILKAQKINVRKTIQKSLEEREMLKSKSGPAPTVLSDKLSALAVSKQTSQAVLERSSASEPNEQNIPPKNEKETKSKGKKGGTRPLPPPPVSPTSQTSSPSRGSSVSKAFQACEFRVCHTCRPLFRDRCFTSIESVYNGETRQMNGWIPQLMPVAPAVIMRTIGLKQTLDLNNRASILDYIESEEDDDGSEFDLGTDRHCDRFTEDGAIMEPMRHNKRKSACEDHKSYMQIQKYASDSSLHLAHQEGANAATDIPKTVDHVLDTYGSQKAGGAKIKPQPSSVGFQTSLAKDMKDIIQRASREARQNYSRRTNGPTRDILTGLDGKLLERLSALYRNSRREIFDLGLWRALSEAILVYASRTALPGRDGEDGLGDERNRINGLGIMIEEEGGSRDDGVIGLALTEEAAENCSPDIITSV